MGESIKAVLALLLIIGLFTGALAWTSDRPDGLVWSFRIGGPILTLLALGILVKLQFRADLAHDYLHEHFGTFFNRDGFCFSFLTTSVDGIAFMNVFFQNQYDKPCIGRIALRPARGFFMNRAKIESINYEIECGPAAFGCVRIAIPIAEKLQGKTQSFEVGASAKYPQGKGERLRFRDGVFLRTNTNFGNSFGTALAIAGAATGSIALSKPAMVKVKLPRYVAADISDTIKPVSKTFWQLGDSEIEFEAPQT